MCAIDYAMLQLAAFKNFSIDRRVAVLFVAMAALDLLFLVLHSTHVRFDVPGSGLWLISRDRGFPELYQYLKELTVVALLVGLHRTYRSWVYAVWAVGFLYLFLDDSLEIHETLGERLAIWLGLGARFSIDARDLGQVLFSAMVGVTLLASVVLVTVRDRSPARRLSGGLILVFGALAFFGVVADVIDVIDIYGLVEDGGEMAAMTLAVAVVAQHRAERDRSAWPSANRSPGRST